MSKLKRITLPAALLSFLAGMNVAQAEEPGNNFFAGSIITEDGLDNIIDLRTTEGEQMTYEGIHQDFQDILIGARIFLPENLRLNGAVEIPLTEEANYTGFLEHNLGNVSLRGGMAQDREGRAYFLGLNDTATFFQHINLTLGLDAWYSHDEAVDLNWFLSLQDGRLHLSIGRNESDATTNIIAGVINPGAWGLYTRTGISTDEENERQTSKFILADESTYGIGNFQFYNNYFNNIGWGGSTGQSILPGWAPFDANASTNIAFIGNVSNSLEGTILSGSVYAHPTDYLFVSAGIEVEEQATERTTGSFSNEFYSRIADPVEFWFKLEWPLTTAGTVDLTGYLGLVEQF